MPEVERRLGSRISNLHQSTTVKNRLERVNELIKRELTECIRRDITFTAKLVTVQEVSVTPDLKHAHIYIGVIGTEQEAKDALNKLHDTHARLQREVSKRVILKYTPKFHFKLDTAGQRGDRVLNLLDELGLPPEAPAEEDANE
jgi:ribosome-binding factor A